MDSSGTVYVADSGNNRVQKFVFREEEFIMPDSSSFPIIPQSPRGTVLSLPIELVLGIAVIVLAVVAIVAFKFRQGKLKP